MLAVSALTRPGLQPASFTLAAGECLTLSGPSGSGKTLLMRAVADLDPNQGVLEVDGKSRAAFSAPDWRRKIGYVPAETGWWAARVGAHFTDLARAAALLPELGLTEDALTWSVGQISTGEKQRLALIRALLLAPEYLLLDEPTSALDAASRDLLEALLEAEIGRGLGLLLTTHDPDQARRLGDRHMHIDQGRLVVDGAGVQ